MKCVSGIFALFVFQNPFRESKTFPSRQSDQAWEGSRSPILSRSYELTESFVRANLDVLKVND
jgi:hypothetical protein